MQKPACDICVTQYSSSPPHRPKVLGCGHTICEDCVQQCANRSNPPVVQCPNCRRQFDNVAVGDIPINFGMLELIQALNLRNSERSVAAPAQRTEPVATVPRVVPVPRTKPLRNQCSVQPATERVTDESVTVEVWESYGSIRRTLHCMLMEERFAGLIFRMDAKRKLHISTCDPFAKTRVRVESREPIILQGNVFSQHLTLFAPRVEFASSIVIHELDIFGQHNNLEIVIPAKVEISLTRECNWVRGEVDVSGDLNFSQAGSLEVQTVRLNGRRGEALLKRPQLRASRYHVTTDEFTLDNPLTLPGFCEIVADSITINSPLQSNGARLEADVVSLNCPYHTEATLEIVQRGWTKPESFGRFTNRSSGNIRKKRMELSHSITARKGLQIAFPECRIVMSEERSTTPVSFDIGEGAFEVYAARLDIPNAVVTAQRALIDAPEGIHFGRLIEDPNSNVFVSFSSHSQSSISHNLGGDIIPHRFDFLNQEKGGVYDGRFLLTLPRAVPNKSSVFVKGECKLFAPFLIQCNVSCGTLTVDSEEESICEGNSMTVFGSMFLKGNGNLVLKRNIGSLHWTYHTYGGIRYSHPGRVMDVVCSDAATLTVQGALVQEKQSCVINNGSSLIVSNFRRLLRVENKDINTSLYQRTYTKEEQAKLGFIGATASQSLTYPSNSIADNGCLPYVFGFQQRTNNFAGAENIFKAQSPDIPQQGGAAAQN